MHAGLFVHVITYFGRAINVGIPNLTVTYMKSFNIGHQHLEESHQFVVQSPMDIEVL
jgi:hypothetical protein